MFIILLTFFINFLSININGLRSIDKLNNIISLADDWNIDVLLIQETHWDTEFVLQVEKCCNWKFYCSNFSNKSCGVAILVNSKWKNETTLLHSDNQGRFITINLEQEDTHLKFACVYAPSICSERLAFFKAMRQHIKHENMIIGGDFNITFAPEDRYNTIYRHDNSMSQLSDILSDFQLCDIWRKRFPNDKCFSWKRVINNELKRSRLDFFLVSENFRKFVSHICYRETSLSDHSFVLLKFKCENIERGPGVWVLNNAILNETEYNMKITELIHKEKQCSLYDSEFLVWWDNFKFKIKKMSQIYCTQRNKERYRRYNAIQNKLFNFHNSTNDDIERYESLKAELGQIEMEKCQGAVLRSKAKWAIESDRNTKYFLNLEKYRQKKSSISELLVANGDTVSDTDSILNTEFDFYRELYSCVETDTDSIDAYLQCIENKVEANDKLLCDKAINNEEIRSALFKMKKQKTPGPDGLTVEFFIKFWNGLQDILFKLFQTVYEEKCMSRTMRHGHITLIYKKGDKRQLKNYRPISLLNVDYKILARVMSNRLKYVIPKIVSSSQSSCIVGKDISDTIASIRDIIYMVEKDNSEGYILKIDQEKAFDRVSHDYLFKLLEKFGFGHNFLRWIRIFYNQIYSAVKCNGHISKYFQISNSVRQGCPLSALLFVLTAEPLALHIKSNSNIRGIDIPNTDANSLIYQHADDTTLTLSDRNSINAVFREFDKYSTASGSKVNKAKSEILCLGKCYINDSDLLQLGISKCDAVIQVLGVYLGRNQNQCDDKNWKDKLVKIKSICNMWKQRHLNLQGRAVIVSSLLLSKLWYTLMVQPIPEWALREIKTITMQFLWLKKSYPIRYCTLIGQKQEGGLYIPDIESKVKSFRLKFLKRFLDVDHVAIWKQCFMNFLQSEFKMNLKEEYFYMNIPKNRLVKLPYIYQELLSAWYTIYENIEFTFTNKDILNQPLFYNPKLVYKNDMLYFKSFIDAGIKQIKDITYEVIPGFLRISAIKEMVLDKCPDITEQKIEMAYTIIRNSIPLEWFQMIEKQHVEKDNCTTAKYILHYDKKHFPLGSCRTNFLYKLSLSKVAKLPISSLYWEEIFPDFDLVKTAKVLYLKIKLPDMIDLDFRIFHTVIYTNSIMAKIGYVNDDKCNFCQMTENLTHLLFSCKRLEDFISFLSHEIESICRHMPNEYINRMNFKQLVLLGYTDKNKSCNFQFLNLFLSQARLCIFKTRALFIQTGKQIELVSYFKSCLEKNITYIYTYYKNNNMVEKFECILNLNSLIKLQNEVLKFNW